MTGITDTAILLSSMRPERIPGEYIFASIPAERFSRLLPAPLLAFSEEEGVTVIMARGDADKNGLSYDRTWARITLTVHSDLTAVGFLAAVTGMLAEHGICVNVVSAWYHDHLFIPAEGAERALSLLEALSDGT